ncbi:MAG TPA: TonB-dependent receptor [Steroidobacteraceae bacterium]|jgi:outer membrane receptor protein involved in Fe transport
MTSNRLMALATAAVGAVLCLFHASPALADDSAAEASTESLDQIVVTARKREESVASVPESITVFTGENLAQYNIQSFADYATKTPNISFSYGGGPTGISDARTVAIRGITGQNLYGTSGATGFYIDDTPVPGSVDPRVLDIASIEVLKGPQGTLFGESSLGGNVRLITKKPNLADSGMGYMVEAGATSGAGSPDGGANVIGNLVLIPDVLAARVVAFGNHDGGYLTRTFPDPSSAATDNPDLAAARTSVGDQGAQTSYGGSASLLFQPVENFDARLRVLYQNSWDHGFPATYAPLPDFKPDYTLNRAFDVQPMAWDKWALPSLDLSWRGSGWSLVSSTSYFYRHTRDIEDSTYGTQQIFASYYEVAGLPAQPYLWDGEHYHNQLTEELRVSWDPWQNLSGTVGAFYSHTNTKFVIPPTYANGLVAATATSGIVGPWPNDEIWTQNNPATQKDKSLFGELYYTLFDHWNFTLGLRKYWLDQTADYTADGYMNFGPTPSAQQDNSQTGLDPKYSIAYKFDADTMVYATASKGFRAGGAQAELDFCALPNLPLDAITHLKSDTLWTYEAGAKIQLPHPGLLVSLAGFHIDWRNLQQQVALPCGAYFEINGDRATVNGAEAELAGHIIEHLQVHLGVGYESTKITEPGALADVGVLPGSRILHTPAWTATAGAYYDTPLTSNLDGFVSADYSYTGNDVSLLNGGAGSEAIGPAYSLLNGRFGVQRGKSEISINLRNITNAKPNLGDIGYVGYAQYSAAGSVIPQVATLQPFTILLQYKKNL